MTTRDRDELREVLKLTAVALKRAEVPFALCGGYAAWVHGAPEPTHDADFLVAADDADRAAEAVSAAGLVVEQPPEDWLFKVRAVVGAEQAGERPPVPRDGVFVDVLWRLYDRPVDAALLTRSTTTGVLSVEMPVLHATDVVAGKLAALDEHFCDFAALLPVARALREQVDWRAVDHRVGDDPYAGAFLHLLGRLRIIDPADVTDR